MLIYDSSFTDVMEATQREATSLGAHVYGSEHILLGLLLTAGPVNEAISAIDSTLNYNTVHHAIINASDDAPLLHNLGLATVATQIADAPKPQRTPRHRHTPELQTALNTASTKWGQLRKAGYLPRQSKLDSTVLWLAVLEPSARAARLLHSIGVDPDQARSTVLSAAVGTGNPIPPWPAEVRVGPITRMVHWFFNRTSTSA